MRYLIIVEETATGFSAYSPDLPGCAATGKSKAAVEKKMKEQSNFIRRISLVAANSRPSWNAEEEKREKAAGAVYNLGRLNFAERCMAKSTDS